MSDFGGDYDNDDGGYEVDYDNGGYENDVSYSDNANDITYEDNYEGGYEAEPDYYTAGGFIDGGYNTGFQVGGYDDVYMDAYAPGCYEDSYGYDYWTSYSPGVDFIVLGGGCYGTSYIGDEVVYVERDGRVSGNIAAPYNANRPGRNWPSWPVNVNCKACNFTGPTNVRKLEMQKWPKVMIFLSLLLIWSGLGLIIFICLLWDDDNFNWGHKCANCNKRLGRGIDY